MSICANIYIFIYVVKFSIADVESWEKNQKEQLLTNSSGMYIAIYAYICIYVCIAIYKHIQCFGLCVSCIHYVCIAKNMNIALSWQEKYVNLIDIQDKIR